MGSHTSSFLQCILLAHIATHAFCLSLSNRRQVLQHVAAASTSIAMASDTPAAVPSFPGPAAVASSASLIAPTGSNGIAPLLSLPNGQKIPRVGYSLYKTALDEVVDGVTLALQSGVTHFDVATSYQSNAIVGRVLQDYWRGNIPGLKGGAATTSRQERQGNIFVTHKISNHEQSKDIQQVIRAVEQQRSLLQLNTIHLGMIHSPLTDTSRRLASYEALLELQRRGRVGSVGVANYGIQPLQEIVDAGLPPPDVIQLILSPFNQQKDIVAWARQHNSTLSCSAWSKLSSAQGPIEGWSVLAKLAQQRNMTKAQVLVRWAVQSQFLCVPRGSAKYKIDRQAIQQNSWEGTKDFVLTEQEMAILNELDEQLPAGRLGIIDGWEEKDILGDSWDPTKARVA